MVIWQGDIGFEYVDRLPDNVEKVDGLTVALGEATGHHHSFKQNSQVQLYALKNNSLKHPEYAVVQQPAELQHQEHAVHKFKKGIVRIIRQRGFDVQKGIQRLRD